MTWQSILKAPNPYGGQWQEDGRSRLSKEDYYKMSEDNKRKYHNGMASALYMILKKLRGMSHGDELNPKTPMLNEMKDVKHRQAFHKNQRLRIINGNPAYYDEADEAGRKRKQRLNVEPTGKKLEDLTEEEYNAASRQEKMQYHIRQRLRVKGKGHSREFQRMENNPNYTAPYIPSSSKHNIEYTKEQYEQMSDDEKRKFHGRMSDRYKKSGNNDMKKWHSRMMQRIRFKRNLPTYYSPEDEENA
jgi:hypothetical protein